jgi:hypothetical protein
VSATKKPLAGAGSERDSDALGICLSPARSRSPDWTALAQQDSYARQSRDSFARGDARIAANRIKGEAKAGADPAAERKSRAEQRQRAATLGRLANFAGVLQKRPTLRGLPTPDYVADEVAQVRRLGMQLGSFNPSCYTLELRRTQGGQNGHSVQPHFDKSESPSILR